MFKSTQFALVLFLAVVCISFREYQVLDLKASISRGKDVYITKCLACHLDEGQGIEDVYPPLAKSDYLMADKKRSIQQVLNGLKGPIKGKGQMYDMEMTPVEMTDQETSDVLNYVRNSWGNKGVAVTPEEVKASRKK
jgi:mono/diheme cytochrome c family protein